MFAGKHVLVADDVEINREIVMALLEDTRIIRNSDTPKGQSIPIIAMTANVFREDIEKCLEAGMNAHVGKPLDIHDMLRIMKRYLL